MQPASPGFNPYAPPAGWTPPPAGPGEPPPPGSLRVDGAFGRAFETMKAFLFAPFDLGKWFVFGFIVWLADLGEGGTSIPTNFPTGGGSGRGGGLGGSGLDLDDILSWLRDHRAMVIACAVVGGVLVLGLTVLLAWLSARGTMMSLRAIALNHARLGEHWNETREAAWSYFGFRMLLTAISLPVTVVVVVWGVVAFFAIRSGAGFMDYVLALAAPAAALVGFSLLLAPVHFLGRNILAPLLLKSGAGLRASWSRTLDVVRTNLGGVVVFLLVRILIAFVQGIAETLAVYLTCCIGLLPVIRQALCAPFHVFERAYTLRVLESLGPEYKLIADAPAWQPPYPGYPSAP